MEPQSPAIFTEGLVKRYGKTTALAGLDIAVPPGMVQGVLGPNGAGKTTLIRILATLLRPDAGRALVGGLDVTRQPDKVRNLIALTGQFAAVDEDLTGRENLLLIARLLELSRKAARRRADELLERFGLAEAAGRLAKTYSGGMRRRLDLAMGLAGEPPVLFLDEPTTGLDPRSRADVWDMIRGLAAAGTTVLLTTQDLDEADRLAGRIAVIDRGRLIDSGTPAELKAKVGGQSLDVRPAEPGQLAKVGAIVAEAAGTGAGTPSERDGAVSAPLPPGVSGTEVLAAVSHRLGQAGIDVTELGLRLASLDEVFLTLTGGT
ncbi:MAG TPA: ATP-binding cassette domain-containing protein [Streptosporangiaceae bacterium]|nr:ATP-binding cassette domain-containing protein [Streptosporangiaceae bacterium]